MKSKVVKRSRTLFGSWAWKHFCVPHTLFVGNRLQYSSLPESQRVYPESRSSRKEGDAENKGGGAKKQYPALQQGPGSAPRDTHNNIFKFIIELNPPTNGRCQHSSFQRRPSEARLKGPEKFTKRLPETRLKECRHCTHPNLISNPTLEPFL